MSLEPSWQVLRAAVRDAPMGIAVCDEDGRIVAVSTSLTRLLRMPSAEIIGRPFLAFVHPLDRPRALASYFEAVVAAAAGVRNGRTALRCLTGDHDTVSVEVSWTVTEADESTSACGILYVTAPTGAAPVIAPVIAPMGARRQPTGRPADATRRPRPAAALRHAPGEFHRPPFPC